VSLVLSRRQACGIPIEPGLQPRINCANQSPSHVAIVNDQAQRLGGVRIVVGSSNEYHLLGLGQIRDNVAHFGMTLRLVVLAQ